MSYFDTMTHKMTIAAIYSPQAHPFESAEEIERVHAANCRTCNPPEPERSVAWHREEADPCEAGTAGCSINHQAESLRGLSLGCATW